MSRKPSISQPNAVPAGQSSDSFSVSGQPPGHEPAAMEGPSKRLRTGLNGEASRIPATEEESRKDERSLAEPAKAKTLTKKNVAEFNRENQRATGPPMDQRNKNR